MSIIRQKPQMLEIEQICREAISKLRANNGCDITFKSISEGHTPWDDPLNISILYMHADFNGKYFEFAMQSKIFTDTEPTSVEEEKVFASTGDTHTMIMLRVAKILFGYYSNWLKDQGLSARVANTPVTSTIDTTPPVYTNQSGTVSQLHIGSKIIDISDRYARSSIDDLQDQLDQEQQRNRQLQDRLDLMEAILRSKGLL